MGSRNTPKRGREWSLVLQMFVPLHRPSSGRPCIEQRGMGAGSECLVVTTAYHSH